MWAELVECCGGRADGVKTAGFALSEGTESLQGLELRTNMIRLPFKRPSNGNPKVSKFATSTCLWGSLRGHRKESHFGHLPSFNKRMK